MQPGFQVYDLCLKLGIKEIRCYGFTVDNPKRPAAQNRSVSKSMRRSR
ncbi:MAG: hypothetical protein ACYCST_18420 [Acidimicrobiales bacterium]